MPREFARHERLATEIHRALSELLRVETRDPRLAHVSLTAVDLSKDLGVARVYFGLLDPDEAPEPALEGLERAAGFLRSKLGHVLKVRHVPELRFTHDDSAERSMHISELLDRALHRDDRG